MPTSRGPSCVDVLDFLFVNLFINRGGDKVYGKCGPVVLIIVFAQHLLPVVPKSISRPLIQEAEVSQRFFFVSVCVCVNFARLSTSTLIIVCSDHFTDISSTPNHQIKQTKLSSLMGQACLAEELVILVDCCAVHEWLASLDFNLTG